jgi:hypothetical protein
MDNGIIRLDKVRKEYPQVKDIIWIDMPDVVIDGKPYQVENFITLHYLFKKGGTIYLMPYENRGFNIP